MNQWPSAKARRVLAALLRLGWSISGMVRVEWAGEGSVLTQRLMRTHSLDSPQQWSCIYTCAPGGARSRDTTGPSDAFFRVDMEKP